MTELKYDPARVNNLKFELKVPLEILAVQLSPLAFAVGVKMVMFANFKSGKLTVGQACLADRVGVSKRSIPKAVRELVSAGIIAFNKQGNGREPAHYTILSIANKKQIPDGIVEIEEKKYTDKELVDLAYEQVKRQKPNTTVGLKIHMEKCVKRGVMYAGVLIRGVATDALLIEKIKKYNFPVNPLSIGK